MPPKKIVKKKTTKTAKPKHMAVKTKAKSKVIKKKITKMTKPKIKR